MRKTMMLLAILGLTGPLWAADPIIGTWKLNVAKSTIPPSESSPKGQTEIYREMDGDQIEFSVTITQKDGSVVSGKLTWPKQGGTVKAPAGQLPKGRSYVEILVAPGEWYVAVLDNGKQTAFIHKTISKDRKTMTQTFGDESVWVFDRQ